MVLNPAPVPPATDRGDRRRRRAPRGQAVTEFALLLPLMLAFLGISVDFARVFQAWLTLESATRSAAEAAATTATDGSTAQTIARRTACQETQKLSGFTPSASPSPNNIDQCVSPTVTVTFNLSSVAPGASTRYPIGSATVATSMPFQTIFAYPVLTQNGSWTLRASSTYNVVQGRK